MSKDLSVYSSEDYSKIEGQYTNQLDENRSRQGCSKLFKDGVAKVLLL